MTTKRTVALMKLLAIMVFASGGGAVLIHLLFASVGVSLWVIRVTTTVGGFVIGIVAMTHYANDIL